MLTEAVIRQMLDELIAVDGQFDGAKLRLFKNNVEVGRDTVIGDLETCTFSGYADSAALVWVEPHLEPDNDEYTLSNTSVEFRSNTADPFVSGTAYGWALISGDVTPVLLAAGRFDEPVSFDVPERSLQLVVHLNVRNMFTE